MAMTRIRWLLHCLWCKHSQFRSWRHRDYYYYLCVDCGHAWKRRIQ